MPHTQTAIVIPFLPLVTRALVEVPLRLGRDSVRLPQDLLQLAIQFMRQRRFQDLAVELAQMFEHFIRRGFADENEQRRFALVHIRTEFFHHVVVDTIVRQRAR